jgi:hypothetical protein
LGGQAEELLHHLSGGCAAQADRGSVLNHPNNAGPVPAFFMAVCAKAPGGTRAAHRPTLRKQKKRGIGNLPSGKPVFLKRQVDENVAEMHLAIFNLLLF